MFFILGNYDNKEALSVNDKIMHTIYNIAIMWPIGLAILSLVVVSISLVVCYKYSKFYSLSNKSNILLSLKFRLKFQF